MSSDRIEAQGVAPHGQSMLPVPSTLASQPLPRTAATADTESDRNQPRNDQATAANAEPRAAFSTHVHQYLREYIQLADQKAMFFFAGSTALLAFLFRSDVSSRWLKPVMTWNILDLVAFVAMAALGISAVVAMWVLIPRTNGSRRGHVFWDAIAEFQNSRAYADDLSQLTAATLAQLHAEHCHELALVCRKKYKVLKAGLWIGALGLVATIIVLLFLRTVAAPA
jgi:hypothetical protein